MVRQTALFCGLLGLVPGCASEVADTDDVPVSTVTQAIVAGRCADGTQEQVFAGGLVGCAGAVTFANRNALCAPGSRTATAAEWVALRAGIAPIHDYWTANDLRFSGQGSSACSVSAETGNLCGTTPMRVCTATGSDPENNICNWTHCGLDANAPDQFFGGCVFNATAGALCIVGGCADGSIEQTFAGGMVGCAGAATYASRAALCGPGYRIATAAEWVALRNGLAPTHDYWTSDPLKFTGSGSSSCFVSTTTGNDCGTTPMRVCTAAGGDPEGNVCNWTHCGIDANTPDQFFGGCVFDTTAGALCVPSTGCADGSAEQVFEKGMVGCAGSVAFASRDTLCAPGYQPATAAQWVANRGGAAPTHDYWTDDPLKYSGSGPSSCFVSTTAGNDCGTTPMRVCVGSDPEGNICNWTHCGIDANTPDQFFGGCAGDINAGTLCIPVMAAPALSGTNALASHFPVGEIHAAGGASTAGSIAAAATMGAQGYSGASPPGGWETAVGAACSGATAAGSLWPAHCDPAGLAAALTTSTASDWQARAFADTDQARALNEMVASLAFYRSPAIVPIYGQADHWVAVTQITANNLGGGAWSVTQVKLFDGGPSGQVDSSFNSYATGLISLSGTVWANVYDQPVSIINPSCDATGCSSDPYFERYVRVFDPPRGAPHPPVSAIFTGPAAAAPGPLDARAASSRVREALAAAGVDADPQIADAIRRGTPGAAFPVHAAWPSGRRWDYYLVPILAAPGRALAFVQLAAQDGRFEAVHVPTRPVPFAPVSLDQAAQRARRALAPGERLTGGVLTWDARTRARLARSPSAPYYEFGVAGAAGTRPAVIRVTLDRGAVARGS